MLAASSSAEVEPLLDQLQPLERIGGRQLDVDPGQALLHGLGGALAPSLGLVGVERLEIAANRPTLIAAFGEGGLVLV